MYIKTQHLASLPRTTLKNSDFKSMYKKHDTLTIFIIFLSKYTEKKGFIKIPNYVYYWKYNMLAYYFHNVLAWFLYQLNFLETLIFRMFIRASPRDSFSKGVSIKVFPRPFPGLSQAQAYWTSCTNLYMLSCKVFSCKATIWMTC